MAKVHSINRRSWKLQAKKPSGAADEPEQSPGEKLKR